METSPKISVLMTVYNGGRFLEPAIRSISNQVFRDWEFVIVDDASTDGSAEIVARWAEADPRIRLISNAQNKGQTPCLNQGLEVARGRWIARQDADDLSHPLRLMRQFERVVANDRLVLLGTAGRIIDENDKRVGLLDVPLTAGAIAWWAPFLNPFVHTAVLVKTEIIRGEFGGYDESFRIAQDYDLWTRISAKYPSANLPDRLVAYRHLTSSLSKTGKSTAFAEADHISKREAARHFGELPSREDLHAMSAFRHGLSKSTHRGFWKFYQKRLHAQSLSMRREAALHRLKSAGAMGGIMGAGDVVKALALDLRGTLRWFKDRYV
jgi:hypothetical protein